MTSTGILEARATYARLARTRGMPALVGLSAANILGTSLQILALSVLVYQRTGSALWSSSAFAAGFLPQLVGGAFLTSLADRWPAGPVLAAGGIIRAALAGVLGFRNLSPAVAILLVAVVAMVQPVPSATQSALVSRLLTGELYILGRSVFNLVSSGSQLLGLAVGGTVVAAFGTRSTLVCAAVVQLAGLVTIVRLPSTSPTAAAVAGRWHPGQTWRGNATLLGDRAVRRILLSWWLPLALLVGAESLVVAYVGQGHGSGTATGMLLAAFPAGAAVGDLIVGRWLPASWRRRWVPWLLAVIGLGLLPLGWHPGVAVTAGCLAVASAGTSYQLGGQSAFLEAVPEQRRGLAFGLVSTGMMTGQGIGPVVSGAVADLVGAAPTMTALGIAVLVAAMMLGRLPPEPAAGALSSPFTVPMM